MRKGLRQEERRQLDGHSKQQSLDAFGPRSEAEHLGGSEGRKRRMAAVYRMSSLVASTLSVFDGRQVFDTRTERRRKKTCIEKKDILAQATEWRW
jgi:hypothetical protein